MPVLTVDDLRSHLRLAIGVELATVPLYLYATYSIVDQFSDAALLIKSIVAEEMLHAALVSNILLAVGGTPPLGDSSLMPRYPMALPHHRPELILNLEPCSMSFIANTLMVIEQPEAADAQPQADDYTTLGQFYAAIEESITRLAATTDLFANPQIDRQIDGPIFYRPVAYDAEDSGGLIQVRDADSAIVAIETIIHQGEGLADHRWADESHQELTHFYKLKQIHDRTTPLGEVHSAVVNPTHDSIPAGLQSVAELFDAAYRMTFQVFGQLFEPRHDKGHLSDTLYRLMLQILRPLGLYLMHQPGGAPVFAIREFRMDPVVELRQLATAALREHPAIKPAAEAILEL